MIIMNLNVPMKFRSRNVSYTSLPIMLLSLGELWPQVVQQQFLALAQQVEAKVLMVVEPLKVVDLSHVVV